MSEPRKASELLGAEYERRYHDLTEGFEMQGWAYRPSTKTLEHKATSYWIPVHELSTPAKVLDWIAQVAGKGPHVHDNVSVGALVRCIDRLLPLQELLCGCGTSQSLMNVDAYLDQAREQVAP